MENIFDLVKIKKDLYFLDYPYDYYLDDFLQIGAERIRDLLKFVKTKNNIKGKMGFSSIGAGCTTIHAQNSKGEYVFGRNFDYLPAPTLLLRTHPRNGYKSISTTDMNFMLYGKKFQKPNTSNEKRLFLAPYCPMDGINEKGLAIAILEVHAKGTKQHSGKTPILSCSIIRAVLDKCADCREAVTLFRQFDIQATEHYDYHFHVVDKKGKSIVVEFINNKMHIIYGQPYAMNFYLSKGGDNSQGIGRTRERIVRNELALSGDVLDENHMMRLLDACKLKFRHKRKYMIVTNWSNVFNCNEKSVVISNDMDYSVNYKFWLK